MQPIPIVLVSGFFGAGKTTLMRRLIGEARTRALRAAVVVNEFGAEDIDSHILRAADAELLAGIVGGCACCSGQDELHWALQELGDRPAAQRPDVILMETSGLADPALLLDVLTAAQLLPIIRLATIVTVIDATTFGRREGSAGPTADDAHAPIAALMRHQIELADLLVLGKADLAGEAQLQAATATLRALNSRAQLQTAVQGAIDCNPIWRGLSEDNQRDSSNLTATAGAASTAPAGHAASHTVTCPLPHPVPRARLEAALQALGPQVWRAKGFVRLAGESGMFLLQYTGAPSSSGAGSGRFTLAPFYLPPLREEPPTALVFIGAVLDKNQLLRDFAALGPLLTVY